VVALGAGFGRPVAPELVAPVNTEVALVDGTVLENPDGLRLPEGAVVRVGEGGSARIGDTVLRPGDVATVEEGRLRVEHGQPVGSVTSASPAQGGAPGAGSSRSPSPGGSRSPAPRAKPSPSPARTPRATPARTATPAPTRPVPTPAPSRPAPTPAPTPTAPTPTATPFPSPSDSIIRPLLRARFVAPASIRVTWTAVPDASSYVLVATGSRVAPAPWPQYPGDRVIGEYPIPPETPLRFRVPDGIVEVRLLVVALAPDGSVISRSRVVVLATGG
jgi:hypothetical protein